MSRKAKLVWVDGGWAEIHEEGEPIRLVRHLLQQKVMLAEPGLYIHDVRTGSTQWFSHLWRQHTYRTMDLLVRGRTWKLEAAKIYIPRHGQRFFWTFRTIQAGHG